MGPPAGGEETWDKLGHVVLRHTFLGPSRSRAKGSLSCVPHIWVTLGRDRGKGLEFEWDRSGF